MTHDSIRKPSYKVVIVGGGISGLATAYSVMEEVHNYPIDLQCTVIEQEDRWGGKILTHVTDDRLIEGGPDSFLTSKPWALELCRTLGLQDHLIPTNMQHNRTFSFCRGALRELPQGLLAFRPQRIETLVSSGLLSMKGMLRMAAERYWPRQKPWANDETLSGFFRRRFGPEAFDYLIEPLVAGIYAGDADELSIEATFPRFRELEREFGSVIKGMRIAAAKTGENVTGSGRPASLFMSLRGGVGELIHTLVRKLLDGGVNLSVGTRCVEILPPIQQTNVFRIGLGNGETLTADAIVLTTPTFQTARLLRSFQSEASCLLDGIPYASTATVSMAFPTEALGPRVQGFGFVVPRKEQRPILAATWSSLKWPHRSKTGETLIRCYLGGRGRERIIEQDDQTLIDCVRRELLNIVGITTAPVFTEIHRWIQGMPQYVLGHQERIAAIHRLVAECPGLYVTGAGFYGIGIPDCIREGTKIGRKLVQNLTGSATKNSGKAHPVPADS